MTSTDPNNWLAKTEIVDMLYTARRNQLEGVIAPKIAKEVFEASGYELVTENKQWMPRNEAAAFRRKLADEAAAKQAAAAPNVDIFGGGGAPAGGGGAPAAPAAEGIFD
jgi:membrane protein involved in colicin uptake